MAARREPTFHGVGRGDDHHTVAGHPLHPARPASHFTRFISGFQAISTLIGVPLALASGYTLYRTNFSPDTACGNLRASIVSMLDKNVDPATRRALVKRDIEAFEASCGAVDPDAHAAFKALLSADRAVAHVAPAAKTVPVAKPVTVARESVKDAPKEAAKDAPKDVTKDAPKESAKEANKETAKETAKAELRPAIIEKKTVVAAPAEAEPAQDAAMTDTRWLDAVRQALVDQPAEPKVMAKEIPNEPAQPQPIVSHKPGEPVLQPNWTVTQPAVQPVSHNGAAPLPPPVAVMSAPASDPNRPVPPAPVPTAQYANNGPSGGSWVAQIPFVGRIIDGRGN